MEGVMSVPLTLRSLTARPVVAGIATIREWPRTSCPQAGELAVEFLESCVSWQLGLPCCGSGGG